MNEADSAAVGAAAAAAAAVWGSPVAGAVAGLAVTEAAKAAAPGASGGFEFPSAEEMNTVLGMWKDRQASLAQKQSIIQAALSSLTQLAGDQESQSYLQQARDSLNLLNGQHDSMLNYVENYIQKLADATNAKQTGEENNISSLSGKTGGLSA
ncbi:hypothetical protein ORV05_04390 [Amycolatopsis cynarae]|uniref:PE domain-containing protein n=1 Tax=Amycolatopsis cynarae TaxID=2995223 RepID=A0ABY7B833_9PSEU|nr:hypothetical protein [Amycolatopsis sp. HUAS 11-8]WAL67036.1 hypothetical protein ORV05_04390 [Amycolatopsis sp. HUAS 11-8]